MEAICVGHRWWYRVYSCAYGRTSRSPYVRHRTESPALEGNTPMREVLREKVIVQNVSVRTDKESVDYVDGFLDQTKRVSK